MRNSSVPGLVLIVLAGSALMSCATSPTGRTQLKILPDEQLDAMGAQAFNEMRARERVNQDARVNGYVRCVADAIVAGVPGRTPWEVVVFDDPAPNAFALPGGKIGVHTGMLKVAKTQDQLAAVIGHEVGHVLAEHANERASQSQIMSLGLAAASGSGYVSDSWMQVLGLGAQVGVLLPYSRIQESEADIIGLDLMARAGFDPRQSVELWRNMSRAGGSRAGGSRAGGQSPPEFLSTHPASSTRIDNLQRKMHAVLPTYEAARASGKRPRCKPSA